MIMEYMCHGDLLGFLRSCRGHPGMYTVSPGHRYQTPTLQLCSRDLLNMATKIASGMCYLSDRKVCIMVKQVYINVSPHVDAKLSTLD